METTRETLRLSDRIQGCLLGAAIGAELGFARCVAGDRFRAERPERMFDVELAPLPSYSPEPHREWLRSATPLIALGVEAYLRSNGRAAPEVFGELFRDDQGLAAPAFAWDGLHTVQEILKEGMHPRISGLATTPSGLLCAAMPAVGIYHFGWPEYAYLDGVELASVAQPQLGADWAGLCAAAVAAAFEPGATGQSVADAVLKIAFQHNKPLFYELDSVTRRWQGQPEDVFLKLWHQQGGAPDYLPEAMWVFYNPLHFVLPLLRRYAQDPRKLLALLVVPTGFMCTPAVSAVIGGAIAGALGGPAAFPEQWRQWAAKTCEPWCALAGVVQRRTRDEAAVIAVTERLAEPAPDNSSLLKDKIRGCILAGAIGNAMGSPVEGQLYTEIDRKYPRGITTVLDPSRLESEDDNQMAMLLVETYLALEGQPVMARQFGQTWLERLNRHHFFAGCMGHTYDLLTHGWDARITGHWAQVTGSTIMCMEPVGIYHLGDPAFAAADALAISYMYQRGLDAVGAAMLAATVAEAFRPEATVESVCAAALAVAPASPFKTFDKRPFASCREYLAACLEIAGRHTDVLAARAELCEKCLLYHQIDPLELWGLALAMFKIARGDVRQAAIGGTNIGRDSDTIAGRAAMLAGILKGASNVPKEWVAMFKPESLQRIHRNADRLAALLTHGKLPWLKKRAAIAAAGADGR